MKTFRYKGMHLARLAGVAALTLGLFAANTVRGADIVKVEEDWQLVVANPDPATFAPQVTTTMSPTADLNALYSVFDLNLRNLPSYEAGGVQLQIWNQDTSVASKRKGTGTLLQNVNETVTWTQRMSVSDGQFSVRIVHGDSQTWGNFGGGDDDSLGLQYSTTLSNLNGYDSSVSVANSGIGYSANRVTSLALVAVRAYSEDHLEAQDNTPKVVYVHQ
jgi:hypothetical protein